MAKINSQLVSIKDIASGDTRQVPANAGCWDIDDLDTQEARDRANETHGIDVMPGNANRSLADCKRGDVVFVESTDPSEDGSGNVIAWLSEVL